MLITVFTSTYNRAHTLPALYSSLVAQEYADFEWILIDDGSEDGTSELVDRWIGEGRINIVFIRQPHGGKHRAINRGLKIARGRLFFIVDSDDELSPDALKWVADNSSEVLADAEFGGLCGMCVPKEGPDESVNSTFGHIDASPLTIRTIHHLKGDLAEIFKTDVLREFPFPEYEGEMFCPEALVWNRLSKNYKLRYFDRPIYKYQYLNGGLTSRIVEVRRDSPRGSMKYYSEYYHSEVPFVMKLRAAVNFWRFAHARYDHQYRMKSALSILCYLPGTLIKWKERKI